MRRKRLTLGNTIDINTTIRIVRNRTSNPNIITKRVVENRIARTYTEQNALFIHDNILYINYLPRKGI